MCHVYGGFNGFVDLDRGLASSRRVIKCNESALICWDRAQMEAKDSLLAEVFHNEAKMRENIHLIHIFASSWETSASREG